ncbi:MAG: hypothetical protein PHH85_06595 [Candidatus Methanoperedens sp.]|nr:hypothetical protein [Candidatus Methanoperedens sp.]
MSKHIEFKKVCPDDDTLYITKELRVNGKKLTTPIKSLGVSSKLVFNDKIKGVNEFYKRFSLDENLKKNSVYSVLSSPEKLSELNYKFNSLVKKTDTDKEINLCFIEYDDMKYPEKKPLEFILDTAYEYSDITPLPIISNVGKRIDSEEKFEKYKKFLEESLEIIDTLNHKPIMGIVPPVQFYIKEIVELYAKNGIDAFVFDFDGKTPLSMHQTIRSFMRSLREQDLLENSFIHSINTNQGRFNKEVNVVGAKDILSFGLGFDSMGERHKPLKGPKEFFEKLKNREDNKLRLFNKDDYGYYRLGISELEEIYPADSIIKKESFVNEKSDLRNLQKNFNMEQIGLETIRLRDIITNQEPKEYLSHKTQVKKEDFKKIIKMKKEISRKHSQLTLF